MELRAPIHLTRVVLALLCLLAAAPAVAQARPELKQPPSQTEAPRGYERTAKQVIAIASRAEKVRAERRHRRLAPTAYTRGPGRWQVSWFADRREVAQVRVDDSSGAILEQWTGDQVAWTMARGYEGAFGRKLNAPYVWIPLCLLFLAPFVDPRRPFRILHLDLLVLLGFGVSHVFFNRGEIDTSVPLVYPVLLYLLGRLLWTGFRPRERSRPAGPAGPAGSAGARDSAAGGLPGRAQRGRLERDRRGVRGRDRRGPDRRRRQPLRPRVQRRRGARGHVRAGHLPGLRAIRAGDALERGVGRPAGRARRRAGVRPAHAGGPDPARLPAAAGTGRA